MASYQMRQRDPLLDSNTQAALERRGKELLGIGLIVLGVVMALILGSYVPEDPSWMSATDEPAQNIMGRFGASVASTLFIIAGYGSWGLPVVLTGWGLRFVIHRAEDRAMGRVIFAPIAIALASVFASTHVPGADWTHSFGLGGLFGDTVLGAMLGIAPVTATFGLKFMSLLFGCGLIAISLFVLGFDMQELRDVGRFLAVGLVVTYASLLTAAGKGANGAMRGARDARSRYQAQRSNRQTALFGDEDGGAQRRLFPRPPKDDVVEDWDAKGFQPDPMRADMAARDPFCADPAAPHRSDVRHDTARDGLRAEPRPQPPREKSGFLSRVPALVRRAIDPEPELVQHPGGPDAEAPSEERIKARINDVIKARVRQAPVLSLARSEPPLVRGRGPRPLVADTTRRPAAGLAVPPLVAAPVAAAPVVPDIAQPTIVQRGAATSPHDLYSDAEDEADLDLDGYAAHGDGSEDEAPTHHAPRIAPRESVVQHPPRRPIAPSRQALAEAQPKLRLEDRPRPTYEHPPLSLLTNPAEIQRHHLPDEALAENARMLESVLDDYGIKGEIVSVRPGPVVTMYELEPAPGLKASRVIGLADDIARSMSALSARVSTVPGRTVIGIELPNVQREKVVLREILAARDFGDSNLRLPLALGKDIGGEPVVANLAKMPHLLIAGTTGSGKSVAINTMILSLLYKLSPEECRLIMIDPKMLELSVYDGIPHLLSPVVTDPKKAVVALKWVVGEMEERYRKMSKMGVRNIEGYNGRVREALAKGEMFKRTIQTGFDEDTGEPVFETEEFAPVALPYIVVIVDEMADLMMVAGKEIEACIQRLAQMARASGIHLIMATQRPSVDVITGTIKANFPTRISFQVTSKIDSRTILGEMGAEQLLGMGDMLYMAGGAKITRIHGPFVSDEEVEEVVTHLKSFGPPEYMSGVVDGPDDERSDDIDAVLGLGGTSDGEDALYDQAVAIVLKDRKCSTSYIQRKLGIGYNKAARLVEQMEEQGLVSPSNHVGKREILVPEQ
ncbi:DNA translocase FtsK 4TM domain-containing protein [Plastorhodobacter daqingensis]|uniref:DNA translocase FtsK n=1 Tax=Plastorhodobacter daqingensis TaxID=1387281 RepID=A0ABW2UNM0_9RHOB